MKQTKNKKLKKSLLLPKVILLFVVLLIRSFPVQAQDSDFTTWNKIKVRHNVSSRIELSGDVEMRTCDALKEIDRWGFSLATSVRVLSFLKAEGGYELHYRNRGIDGWKTRHRYYAGASGTLNTGQWTFSLRERFQHTLNGHGANEFRLRTRLQAAYKIAIWSPYASLEQYHSLGKDEWFHAARFRARGGVVAKLSSHWSIDVFYCYQHESDLNKHILGWELSYRF